MKKIYYRTDINRTDTAVLRQMGYYETMLFVYSDVYWVRKLIIAVLL